MKTFKEDTLYNYDREDRLKDREGEGDEQRKQRSEAAIRAQLNSIREAFGDDTEGYNRVAANYMDSLSEENRVLAQNVIESGNDNQPTVVTQESTLVASERTINAGGVVFVDKGTWDAEAFDAQMSTLDQSTLNVINTATDPSERFELMKEHGFMEYIPGDGSHSGKLLIIVNGHLQGLDGNPQEVGMNYATQQFMDQGYEILHFRVGNAIKPLTENVASLYRATNMIIMDRLNGVGTFEDASSVKSIGALGYSWGGGTVSNISHTLDASEHTQIPVYAALIDAVELGYSGLVQPVDKRPPAEAVFNRYQENDGIQVLSKGEPANGTAFSVVNGLDDQKSLGKFQDHFSIDNPSTQDVQISSSGTTSYLIDNAINFISAKLNSSTQ